MAWVLANVGNGPYSHIRDLRVVSEEDLVGLRAERYSIRGVSEEAWDSPVEAYAVYLHRVGATDTVNVDYARSVMMHPSSGAAISEI